MDKAEKQLIADLRHKVHMTGELMSLRELLDRMEIYGDRTCMVEKHKENIVKYSVKSFRESVYALGTQLISMGFKNKHIAIVSENSYNWVVAFFAITCGVGIAVPIDKELTNAEISSLITKSDAEAVCFSKAYYSTAKKHMEADSSCLLGISLNKKYDDTRFAYIDDLIEKGKQLIAEGDRSFIDTQVDPDDVAAIVFTSGTTGANKGVMLSHHNFASNADGVLESIPPEYSSISLLPMNHVYELSCNIFTSLYMNAIVYINDSLKNFQSNLLLFKPDAVAIVPLVIDTIYNTIWATAEKTGKAKALRKLIQFSNFLLSHGIDMRNFFFKSIRVKFGDKFPTFSCGGAPSRTEHVKCLCDIGFNIYNGYGLTESSPTVTLNLDCRGKPDCAGTAMPKARFKIHEPDADGIGEIWIKGENVTKRGYYKDEAATAASFEDGWFKTGDYGRTDAEGLLYVVGRKKNLIILDNGKNVFPEDVESFFMEHIDYISEVVVFEAEKETRGTLQKIIVAAFYVNPDICEGKSFEDINVSLNEDVARVNKMLPAYKRVQDVMLSTEEFEINSTRKVIRSKVIEKYNKSLVNV